MKSIVDPVFGEMRYDHSWEGIHHVPGVGNLRIIAKAYSDEGISETQRESYKSFLLNPTEYLDSASLSLSRYLASADFGVKPESLRLESALFRQDGVWGFLYSFADGGFDGFSVRFENGRAIADADDALF